MAYNIGDTVICIPGFKDTWDQGQYGTAMRDPKYGGAGYKSGKVFVVGTIFSEPYRGQVLFPIGNSGGVFLDALRLYTKEFCKKDLNQFDFVRNNV